jgi:hypothetical protein
MTEQRQIDPAGASERDAKVLRRCPSILPVLDPHGLTARWIDAEDESVDDEVDVRLPDSDEEVGGIQYCGEGVWMANAWTSSEHEAMAHGVPRTDPALAAADLVGLFRKYDRLTVG